jgi:hypothetical protein
MAAYHGKVNIAGVELQVDLLVYSGLTVRVIVLTGLTGCHLGRVVDVKFLKMLTIELTVDIANPLVRALT